MSPAETHFSGNQTRVSFLFLVLRQGVISTSPVSGAKMGEFVGR